VSHLNTCLKFGVHFSPRCQPAHPRLDHRYELDAGRRLRQRAGGTGGRRLFNGRTPGPPLLALTQALCAELLLIGQLAATPEQALEKVNTALDSGAALEHFSRMVSALGGPADFVEKSSDYLPKAPVRQAILASRSGWVSGMKTRDIGLLVVDLGGGRHKASDSVDARVGFTEFAQVGQAVRQGDVLAVVHAGDAASAEQAQQTLLTLIEIADAPPIDLPPFITRLS
jgi:thymidine phosphorylase